MKKVILQFALILVIGFSFSCKNTNTSTTENTTEETSNTETADKAEENQTETTSEGGAPSFSDAKVQEYVDAYEAYLEEYKKAVESKDMTAFASLGQKGQELGSKAQEISGGLSASDAKKLNEYMLKKSEEIQELSKKLMQ